MLPAVHRLRSSSDFSAVTRQGRRARVGGLMVYLLADDRALPGAKRLADSDARPQADRCAVAGRPVRVGLVVGKAVGGSVVRHRVSRRLRALLSDRLPVLPTGSRMVVRALSDTSGATSACLGRDLDRALTRLSQEPARSRPARARGGSR